MSALQATVNVRDELISQLAAEGRRLLLDPEVDAKNYKHLDQLAYLLNAWSDFAQAISSSNPGYWSRDLPAEVAADYKSAKHAISILVRIHNPNKEA